MKYLLLMMSFHFVLIQSGAKIKTL